MSEKSPFKKTRLEEYREKLYKKITWIIYIVRCADDTYFGGMTRNLKEDLELINVHRRGKYFSKNPERLPVELVYHEYVPFKEAMAKFNYLKKMNKRLKLKLIRTKVWPYGGAWKEFAENNPEYLV